MKNFCHITMVLIFFLTGATWADVPTRYLSVLTDIPLMAGMQDLPDRSVVFDKAEGRIVEETARAQNISPDQVKNFYKQTLPALGWTIKSPQRFSRNGEQLIVNLDKLGSEGLVSFAVSPIQH